MPSAIATRPSAWARLTRFAVIAASLASCSTPWTNERSTLIMSTGKRRSCPSDEKPVPKSSIAIRTPSSCSSSSSARARSPGGALDDDRRLGHLEPEQRRRAARRRRASAARARSTPAGGELLAGEVDPGDERARAAAPSRRHAAVCSHASRSTNSPSGMISPVASATGMKRVGRHEPAGRRVPAQRAPRRRRSRRSRGRPRAGSGR